MLNPLLWQAQNGVNFDFEVKFDLEGQGQSHTHTHPADKPGGRTDGLTGAGNGKNKSCFTAFEMANSNSAW